MQTIGRPRRGCQRPAPMRVKSRPRRRSRSARLSPSIETAAAGAWRDRDRRPFGFPLRGGGQQRNRGRQGGVGRGRRRFFDASKDCRSGRFRDRPGGCLFGRGGGRGGGHGGRNARRTVRRQCRRLQGRCRQCFRTRQSFWTRQSGVPQSLRFRGDRGDRSRLNRAPRGPLGGERRTGYRFCRGSNQRGRGCRRRRRSRRNIARLQVIVRKLAGHSDGYGIAERRPLAEREPGDLGEDFMHGPLPPKCRRTRAARDACRMHLRQEVDVHRAADRGPSRPPAAAPAAPLWHLRPASHSIPASCFSKGASRWPPIRTM